MVIHWTWSMCTIMGITRGGEEAIVEGQTQYSREEQSTISVQVTVGHSRLQ